MKNFFVVVNRKYMVMVQAETNGGAEHKILDNISCAESSLAFDPVEESQHYGWAFAECQVMSFEELIQKDRRTVGERIERYNELLSTADEIQAEVKSLEEKLEAAKADWKEAKEEAEAYRRKFNLKPGYTAREKIEALKK